MAQSDKILEVKDLVATFRIDQKDYEVLHNVSFSVGRNETLCMVGESGCGKSVSTLAVMDLLPLNGKVVSGSIRLEDQELTTLSKKERNAYRGKKMGMIFQEPMTALNPLLTIGFQLTEGLRRHKGMSKHDAYSTAVSYLERVGIANPRERMRQFPFQLSGGLRQRVMIAMVLSVQPSLLIADEPTTALDVTIQKQVMVLLKKLKKDISAGILFITHDLGVVAEIADRVIILYAGRKVEEGPVASIFQNPRHPYTIGLMNAVPNVDDDDFKLQIIPGTFPNLTEDIPGCRFHPRCSLANERCRREAPVEAEYEAGHLVACHRAEEAV
ncbi:ABC transporter ATP-binding protein [Clostridia bacterium]|nr:ABC transporter ATP-binding protein [Clostridia bacterium]